jgi:hypothetical protein
MIVLLSAVATGCKRSSDHTFMLPVTAEFKPVALDSVLVPGRPLQAWTMGEDGSAAVFTQIPNPGKIEHLHELTRNQVRAQPGWKIVEQKVTPVGGRSAMWFVIDGPGTGRAMAPTPTGEGPRLPGGQTPIFTRRIWVAAIRPDDVLHMQFHYPADRDGEFRPIVDRVLKDCRLDGN